MPWGIKTIVLAAGKVSMSNWMEGRVNRFKEFSRVEIQRRRMHRVARNVVLYKNQLRFAHFPISPEGV